MKLFVDSADPAEIRSLAELGLADGVTTNPSLVAKTGGDFKAALKEICAVVDGPVSAEVAALDCERMIEEALRLTQIADNIVVKLPVTSAGLSACRRLSADGIAANLTLCFCANQALLAAKAGAAFISPFIGRLDDANIDGVGLIHEIRNIYLNYGFKTQLLAASIRSVNHVKDAALAGADAASVPPDVMRALIRHPLTDKGLQIFTEDWASTGQSILDS